MSNLINSIGAVLTARYNGNSSDAELDFDEWIETQEYHFIIQALVFLVEVFL